MFEHVGPDHYRSFFSKCRSLLPENGVLLLHTIGRSGSPGPVHPFTAKYIFPGGYVPAVSEVVDASEREGLVLADCETLRLHYHHTIEHWYERTKARRAEIVAMYDERFYRMWILYLATAMTSFYEGILVNYQLQYIRDRLALPLTRDYMVDEERRLLMGEEDAAASPAAIRAGLGSG
jgi:cyclopropane-fatty-acyl-phospholipid synthase